ncbi:hypothetical protein GS432_04860 [Rhodococcus hoagii]|nr:hypothetical protein [Prescottella equi]
MALTANLTPADASGKVQFKDGDDPIGSPVDVANGVAAIQHTFQASGVHSITAVFTPRCGLRRFHFVAAVGPGVRPGAR